MYHYKNKIKLLKKKKILLNNKIFYVISHQTQTKRKEKEYAAITTRAIGVVSVV